MRIAAKFGDQTEFTLNFTENCGDHKCADKETPQTEWSTDPDGARICLGIEG